MPEIQPFRGVRYRAPAGELTRLLAPPYDVITPAEQEELYTRDPRNVVRIVLNRGAGLAAYAEAGETYRRWRVEGVLEEDPEPALYLLEQLFTVAGRPLARQGLLARFKAEDASRGRILPHEQTRAAAREDRYRLLRATGANFSPIFLMFQDAGGRFGALAAALTRTPPILEYEDDGGVAHRLWRITEAASIAELRETVEGPTAYIADGHHRYATALRHGDDVGSAGAWTFGYFTPLEAPGLIVLPYHRLLSRGPTLAEARQALAGLFLLNDAADAAAAARAAAHSTMPYAFGLAEPGRGALVGEARPEAEDLLSPETPPALRVLDTYFLHRVLLPRILGVREEAVSFVHSLREAQSAVAGGGCRLAVLTRPTPVRQIVAVAEARESMPAKSTFFYPKLPSGLVIHPLVS